MYIYIITRIHKTRIPNHYQCLLIVFVFRRHNESIRVLEKHLMNIRRGLGYPENAIFTGPVKL